MPGRCWERKSWGSGGKWRMGVTTLINDWKQQSTTFSIFLHLHHLWKEERYIQSITAAKSQIVLPISNPNLPTPLTGFCFRRYFFPFIGPGNGKPAPVSHSCSWVLMPLKVWHRAVIWNRSPGSGWGCSPALLPMGNGNNCSIYCLVFAAFPHAKQIPYNQKQLWRKKGNIYILLISGDQVSQINSDFTLFQVIQVPLSRRAIWHNKGNKDSKNTSAKFGLRFSSWENVSGI